MMNKQGIAPQSPKTHNLWRFTLRLKIFEDSRLLKTHNFWKLIISHNFFWGPTQLSFLRTHDFWDGFSKSTFRKFMTRFAETHAIAAVKKNQRRIPCNFDLFLEIVTNSSFVFQIFASRHTFIWKEPPFAFMHDTLFMMASRPGLSLTAREDLN